MCVPKTFTPSYLSTDNILTYILYLIILFLRVKNSGNERSTTKVMVPGIEKFLPRNVVWKKTRCSENHNWFSISSLKHKHLRKTRWQSLCYSPKEQYCVPTQTVSATKKATKDRKYILNHLRFSMHLFGEWNNHIWLLSSNVSTYYRLLRHWQNLIHI